MDYPDDAGCASSITDKALALKVEHSLDVIKEALADYKLDGVALSFNGGKDCCVLLHLLYLVLSKHAPFSKLRILYFMHDNSFPEVDAFVHKCITLYGANVSFITVPVKQALVGLVNEGVKAVFMGTRSTDPRSSSLTEFAPTDTHHGWPAFVRVNPILKWSYEDVWKFILALNVPYCELYDKGYTSIGSTVDTIPNPALATEKGEFEPAYKLQDGTKERAGRLSG
jgi:FAD synthetase